MQAPYKLISSELSCAVAVVKRQGLLQVIVVFFGDARCELGECCLAHSHLFYSVLHLEKHRVRELFGRHSLHILLRFIVAARELLDPYVIVGFLSRVAFVNIFY